jgi:hypothetical protein
VPATTEGGLYPDAARRGGDREAATIEGGRSPDAARRGGDREPRNEEYVRLRFAFAMRGRHGDEHARLSDLDRYSLSSNDDA